MKTSTLQFPKCLRQIVFCEARLLATSIAAQMVELKISSTPKLAPIRSVKPAGSCKKNQMAHNYICD
jgi:hypothetical protein